MARKAKAKVEKEPNWVQGQFEGMPAPKHLSGAGMSDDQKVLKDIGETAPMMIRAPEEALSGIAASRTILSQHDTGRSKGLLDPDERLGWEDQAFPDRAHHPVYGYLSHGEFRDNFHGSDLRGYANTGYNDSLKVFQACRLFQRETGRRGDYDAAGVPVNSDDGPCGEGGGRQQDQDDQEENVAVVRVPS
jgi:hypothetical protein